MALPSARPRRRALTASASRLGDRESEYGKRQAQSWQSRALSYVDLIPELSFASKFYSRMLRQVRLFPAYELPNGQLEEIKDGPPVDHLNRIRDPGGGRSAIQGAYGRLMFITGEGVLFGRALHTPDERWSFVWNDEVEVEKNAAGEVTKYIHKTSAADKPKEYGPEEAVAYRMWMPHPRNSGEADSPMRSTADISEELLVLTYGVRSTAISRLTSGIFFIPDEASFAPAGPEGDEDPLIDPFMADWADHLSAQVENPGEAAARVPFLVRMAADLIEKAKHLKIHDPATDYMERELRKEAIDRLALGLDMPREILEGVGQANHWVARSIMADLWPSHGLQVGQQFTGDLVEVYLRPALQEDEFERWDEVVLGIDASQITILTDPSDDADRAFDRGGVGREGYRKMKNIPEEYAPTPEDEEFLLTLKGKRPIGDGAVGGEGATQQNERPAEEGPPLPGPEGDSGRQTRVVASAAMELGAALTAIARCRELAGTRLRQRSIKQAVEQLCPECDETPLDLTASALGEDRLRRLRLDPLALVRGGADHLRTALLSWGWREEEADSLCSLIELHASRTLFEPQLPPLPTDLESHIERLREVA